MIKNYLTRLVIDGLSGMASGLFATLIIGTIIAQVGTIIGGAAGDYLVAVGGFAKTITGAGIGIGVACKLKSSPLVTTTHSACGMPADANTSFEYVLSIPFADANTPIPTYGICESSKSP